MRLQEAIWQIGNRHRSNTVARAAVRFLYGSNKRQITAEATRLIERLELNAQDFAPIYDNDGRWVATDNVGLFGNSKLILKIFAGKPRFSKGEYMDPETIPEGLAAEIYDKGQCNGVGYELCERLNIRVMPTIEEIVPYFFKARESGVVYDDAKRENFGYDANGQVKVLDHEHFEKLGQPPRNFEIALNRAITNRISRISFPFFSGDKANTYIILDPRNQASQLEAAQKRLTTSLHMVGIRPEEIEVIAQPPVIRIPRKEIQLGTPPHAQTVEDFLTGTLEQEMGIQTVSRFISQISDILQNAGEEAQAKAAALLNAQTIAGMDNSSFLRFYDAFMGPLEQAGMLPEEITEDLDAAFDAYSRETYASRRQR